MTGEPVTGASSVVRSLEALGVDVVFGIPGGAILPLYDPLMDSRSVRHILVRHEQGAGHAAEGYAHATGRVGVCMATSGPGATNLVTPIADAYMDSVPMVAITGQVPSKSIGTDAFQEADIAGITLPITKHNYLVTRAEDVARTVREAFAVAASGRPGPVLIDITKDAQQSSCDFDWEAAAPKPHARPEVVVNSASIARALGTNASARLLRVNAAIGVLAVVAIGVTAFGADAGATLAAFGSWAAVSGAIQFAVAVHLRRTERRQLPMLVSGGLSTIAGLGFLASSGMDDAHLAGVSGYMALGAVLYLLWAHRSRTAPQAAR